MIRTLSHTSIQDYLACPRRFEWRRVRRLRKRRRAQALRFGDLFHQGLDLLKRGQPIEDALVHVWEAYRDIPPHVDEDAWLIERETCLRLLCAWDHFTEPLDVIASEVPFEARIKNPESGRATGRFRLRGILDGIVRLVDGRIGVLEHKSTSQSIEPHSDFLRRLRVDSQVSRYLLAARDVGIPADTIVYDVTRKPSIKPRRLTKKEVALLREDGTYFGQPIELIPDEPKRETPEMFGARLTDDICRQPSRYFCGSRSPVFTRTSTKKPASSGFNRRQSLAPSARASSTATRAPASRPSGVNSPTSAFQATTRPAWNPARFRTATTQPARRRRNEALPSTHAKAPPFRTADRLADLRAFRFPRFSVAPWPRSRLLESCSTPSKTGARPPWRHMRQIPSS